MVWIPPVARPERAPERSSAQVGQRCGRHLELDARDLCPPRPPQRGGGQGSSQLRFPRDRLHAPSSTVSPLPSPPGGGGGGGVLWLLKADCSLGGAPCFSGGRSKDPPPLLTAGSPHTSVSTLCCYCSYRLGRISSSCSWGWGVHCRRA
uniref:Uncharacterized protein n=1 Tax=Pipistrellus kuhlii TaxID=59472 RepID=A0A7J7TPX9_PIPKU|nr:hypothetical protein mPipKuh1_009300 [Pipistrellus kuhlii]